MVFDHMVKYNGVYYAAGEDIPIGVDIPEEDKKSIDEIVVEEKKPEMASSNHLYTKSELESMTVKEMRHVAEEKGFSLPTGVSKAETINAFLNLQ